MNMKRTHNGVSAGWQSRGFVSRTLQLFGIIGIFLALNGTGFSPVYASGKGTGIDCDIQHGACTKEIGKMKVVLDIQPKPVKAMEELLFRVTLWGTQPKLADLYIDLGMPGMDMGPNRVLLKAVRPGVYEGKGIIVRCPSGRRTWRARVRVPNLGKTDFIFDVIY